MKSKNFLLILLLLSCNHQEKKTYSDSTAQQQKSIPTAPAQPKKDTVYKDFPEREKFSDLILFGMTVQEWNKFIAKQAKEDVFEEIDNRGWFGSYRAFNSKNQKRNVSFSMEGKFLEPVNCDETKCEIIRVNNIVQSQPVLKEVSLEYNTSDANLANVIVNEFIANHNLIFIGGLEPMTADYRPATIQDYEVSNELDKKFGNEKLANTQRWESQMSYTESIFENKELYAIIKIEETKHNQLTRNYNSDIVGIEEGSRNFAIKIRACSRKFSDIDINQFRTEQQKQEIEARKKSKQLIDSALGK